MRYNTVVSYNFTVEHDGEEPTEEDVVGGFVEELVLLGLDPWRATSMIKNPEFILPKTFDSGFTVGLLRKDTSIALRLAKDEKIPMHSGKIVEQLLTYATITGAADWDHTEMIRILEEWTGENAKENQ